MNFLDFLKNSSNEITTKNINHESPNNHITNINTVNTYKNIKRGDFVKIIYQKNSPLNCYKGYLGEIKEYRKEQDYVLIFLHAINSPQYIKFPLTHFIKYDYI